MGNEDSYIVSMMVAEWFILPIKKVWQRLFMTNMTLQQKPQEQRL